MAKQSKSGNYRCSRCPKLKFPTSEKVHQHMLDNHGIEGVAFYRQQPKMFKVKP